MNKTRQPDFQSSVTPLLQEAVEGVPSDMDLRSRISRRLADSERQHVTLTGSRLSAYLHHPRRRPAVITAVTLLTLVALSAFTIARPLIFSWLGDSGTKTISIKDSMLIDKAVTSQGVTLRLEQGYADAARIALTIHVNASGASGLVIPQLNTMHLTDGHGNTYSAITSAQVGGDGLLEFSPLPSAELGSTQTLTLDVQVMETGLTPKFVAGPWDITFQLQPHKGRSITLTQHPVVQNGIALQPMRLDLGPAGVRLLVRVSGLQPDTSLFSLMHFARLGGDTITGCPPAQSTCFGGGTIADGAPLQLQGPGNQALALSWVEVVNSETQVGYRPSGTAVVGQSGSALLEFLFFTPLHTTQGTVHLTIGSMPVGVESPSSTKSDQMIPGPWLFDIALS